MSMKVSSPRLARFVGIVLVVCTGFLLVQQTLRFMRDPRMPDIPIRDPTAGNWLFDVLRTVKQPGDRLGIWGWAASVWVHSGLLPATRETSTEFAFHDWGPDHFYRRRYLTALRQSPPEFFLEAVGPRQTMFHDRENFGIGTLPELLAFINSNYKPLFDDGNNRLFIRSDVVRDRLRPIEATSSKEAEPIQLKMRSSDSLPATDEPFVSLPKSSREGTDSTRLNIRSDRPLRALILILRAGPADRANLHLSPEPDGVLSECAPYIQAAPPGQPLVCTISLPENRTDVTLDYIDSSIEPQAWLALGNSYGVYADPRQQIPRRAEIH